MTHAIAACVYIMALVWDTGVQCVEDARIDFGLYITRHHEINATNLHGHHPKRLGFAAGTLNSARTVVRYGLQESATVDVLEAC